MATTCTFSETRRTTTATTPWTWPSSGRFSSATQPEGGRGLGLGAGRPQADAVSPPAPGRDRQTRRDRRASQRGQARAGDLDLFYGTPTPGNVKAEKRFAANVFSVTRQLRYSKDETQLALDLCLFINGLPVATFELKNRLTKQTVDDAVQQYKRDRDPKELLFQFGRCMVHFAVDDQEVRMCTHLKGKDSWFLPFNKGFNDGAGNPPNPTGIKTDYLWKQILTKAGLTDIIENYAQVVEEKDEKGRKKQPKQIFPRYHQLDVVRKLLADAQASGVGQTVSDPALGRQRQEQLHRLAGAPTHRPARGAGSGERFDSVIVVTDRRVLDKQIREHHQAVCPGVGHSAATPSHSGDLRRFLSDGKKIIISTVQKFPFILDEIGDEHRGTEVRHHHR